MLLLDLMECLACQITHVISALSFYGVEFTGKLLLNNRFNNEIKEPHNFDMNNGHDHTCPPSPSPEPSRSITESNPYSIT